MLLALLHSIVSYYQLGQALLSPQNHKQFRLQLVDLATTLVVFNLYTIFYNIIKIYIIFYYIFYYVLVMMFCLISVIVVKNKCHLVLCAFNAVIFVLVWL